MLILTLVQLAPALLFDLPRAADLPNHWARLTILNAPPGDPVWVHYERHFAIIPNLGLDLISLALALVLSMKHVAILGWVLALVLPVLGTWRLQLAMQERVQPSLLLLPLVSWNFGVSVGLINYMAGIGLALLGLSLVWGAGGARPFRRLVLANVIGSILFFFSLVAVFAFYATAFLREAGVAGSRKDGRVARLMVFAAGCTLPAVLVLLSEPMGGYGVSYTGKLRIFAAPFVTGAEFGDTVVMAVFLAVVVLGLRAGAVRLAPETRLVVFGFAAALLTVPDTVGLATLLDLRLAVFWTFLLVASLAFDITPRRRLALAVGIVVLVTLRVVLILPAWRTYNGDSVDVQTAIRDLPSGSSVLVVEPPVQACPEATFAYTYHLSAFVVIQRRAAVSSLFAADGMQPVRLRPPAAMDGMFDPDELDPFGSRDIGRQRPLERYDHILLLHGSCPWRPVAPNLTEKASTPFATLYARTANASLRGVAKTGGPDGASQDRP